jgi:hypothetical protein
MFRTEERVALSVGEEHIHIGAIELSNQHPTQAVDTVLFVKSLAYTRARAKSYNLKKPSGSRTHDAHARGCQVF